MQGFLDTIESGTTCFPVFVMGHIDMLQWCINMYSPSERIVVAVVDGGDIMNKLMLQGKWRQLRGGMKAEWGRLTEDERRVMEGRLDQLLGLFQERYGYTRERAAKSLESYLHMHARKPLSKAMPTMHMPQQGRYLLFATAGIALVSAVGWFTFMKMIVEKQPALEEGSHGSVDEFEAEDFEAVMLGYDGALN